jgi:serine/threonine protein kinase
MEYCGGGDLSAIIKTAQKSGRPIPEETVWNYFMQILLALQHCHHPSGHVRSVSSSGSSDLAEGKERRAQILHRDLKPDNGAFLSSNLLCCITFNTYHIQYFSTIRILQSSEILASQKHLHKPRWLVPTLG